MRIVGRNRGLGGVLSVVGHSDLDGLADAGEVGGAFFAGARVSQARTKNRFDFEIGN